jgi:hypothetical protein
MLLASACCPSHLLAGAAIRSPMCTRVHPAFFRIVPTSRLGLGDRSAWMASLVCSSRSRLYNLASVVT